MGGASNVFLCRTIMTDSKHAQPTPSAEDLGPALLAIFETMNHGVTVKDLSTGRYGQVNAMAAKVLGRAAASMLGHTDVEVFSGAQAMVLRAADQQALANQGPTLSEHKLEHPDGKRHDISAIRTVLKGADGSPRWLVCVWTDVSEQRRQQALFHATLEQLEAQQKANDMLRQQIEGQDPSDDASGLLQRSHFEDQLKREADLSAREHREFALVAMAVDHMDDIVRVHGPASRQRVLETLGRLLRAGTRAMDSPCSLGEDRFAVLLSGVGLATAHSRMESLRRQCAEHIIAFGGRQLTFTVSMGVASYPHTAGQVETLLDSAEHALTAAQQRGGNRVTLASILFESVA